MRGATLPSLRSLPPKTHMTWESSTLRLCGVDQPQSDLTRGYGLTAEPPPGWYSKWRCGR